MCSALYPCNAAYKNMQVMLIGDSKVPVGVKVNVCMFIQYIGPVIDGWPVQGVPSPSSPLTIWKISGKENE